MKIFFNDSSIDLCIALLLATGVCVAQVNSATSYMNSISIRELKQCITTKTCADMRSAIEQLARAGEDMYLIRQYPQLSDGPRSWIVESLRTYRKTEDSQVSAFMKTVAYHADVGRFSNRRWNALQYLADGCDVNALSALVTGADSGAGNYKYDIASYEWMGTLSSFGQCNYKPASMLLIRYLSTSTIDLSEAAYESLDKMYPGKCAKSIHSAEIVHCFKDQVALAAASHFPKSQ